MFSAPTISTIVKVHFSAYVHVYILSRLAVVIVITCVCLGINIVCSHRLLGGIVGSYPGRRGFGKDLVKKWISELECLTIITSFQPQAAFTAFTKSLQFQWSYVQRVVGDCQSLFMDLETTTWEKFLPTVMGNEVSSVERILLSLPA